MIPLNSNFSSGLVSQKGPLPKKMIRCSPSGKLDLPEQMKKIQNAIYGFFDSQQDKFYVGKTSTSLRERVSHHNQSTANSSDFFHSEMSKRGSDFYFCIFHSKLAISKLNKKEIETIEKYQAFECGYNGNRGGGGGVSAQDCLTPVRAQRSAGLEGKDLSLITPERYFPFTFRYEKGRKRIYCLLTPKTKKKRGIYVIKTITRQGIVKRYIGTTACSLAHRIAQHRYLASHALEIKISNRIYTEMLRSPERFKVGILHECTGILGPGLEKAFIRAKKTLEKEGRGFNKTVGGNGSCSGNIYEDLPTRRCLLPNFQNEILSDP